MGLALTVAAAGAEPQLMPAPLWRGALRIVLTCSAALDPAVCALVHRIASARATLPIETANGPVAPDRKTVIVSVAPGKDGRTLVAVARRALEIDDAEAPARYFVVWDAAAPETAVDVLLNRILPHRSTGGRRSN